MSYGFRIFNANGDLRVSDSDRVLRSIKTLSLTSPDSGSVSVPDYDSNNGDIASQLVSQFSDEASYSWNNSTKTFSYNLPTLFQGRAIFYFFMYS